MRRKNNLIKRRFGKLVVLEEAGKGNDKKIYWLCLCDCGNITIVRGGHLKSDNTTSCGCHKKEHRIIHGDSRVGQATRLYVIWMGMKKRCHKPNETNYRWYGARGIAVCEEWRKSYPAFKFWAILNGYQDGLGIDRIDNDGNYEPSNCQWITQSENSKKSNEERRGA